MERGHRGSLWPRFIRITLTTGFSGTRGRGSLGGLGEGVVWLQLFPARSLFPVLRDLECKTRREDKTENVFAIELDNDLPISLCSVIQSRFQPCNSYLQHSDSRFGYPVLVLIDGFDINIWWGYRARMFCDSYSLNLESPGRSEISGWQRRGRWGWVVS